MSFVLQADDVITLNSQKKKERKKTSVENMDKSKREKREE